MLSSCTYCLQSIQGLPADEVIQCVRNHPIHPDCLTKVMGQSGFLQGRKCLYCPAGIERKELVKDRSYETGLMQSVMDNVDNSDCMTLLKVFSRTSNLEMQAFKTAVLRAMTRENVKVLCFLKSLEDFVLEGEARCKFFKQLLNTKPNLWMNWIYGDFQTDFSGDVFTLSNALKHCEEVGKSDTMFILYSEYFHKLPQDLRVQYGRLLYNGRLSGDILAIRRLFEDPIGLFHRIIKLHSKCQKLLCNAARLLFLPCIVQDEDVLNRCELWSLHPFLFGCNVCKHHEVASLFIASDAYNSVFVEYIKCQMRAMALARGNYQYVRPSVLPISS